MEGLKAALPVTSFFGGLLGGVYFVMSLRVAMFRRGNKIAMGTGNNKKFEYLMRGHGNFLEYTPFFLLLMAVAEVDGFVGKWLIGLGAVFTLGRFMHACHFFFRAPLTFRFYGMLSTLGPFSTLSGLLVWRGLTAGIFS